MHAADPLHRETWLGRLEVARKRKDAAACRLLVDEALGVLRDDQRIAEAAVLLDAAIQRQARPKDSLVLAHAAALRRAGDHEAARRLHDELLGRNPNSIAIWLSLVRGLIAQGEIGDALAQCEVGLAQNPSALRLRRLQADVLRRSGRRGEGIEILEDLRRKRPADHGIGLALADHALAFNLDHSMGSAQFCFLFQAEEMYFIFHPIPRGRKRSGKSRVASKIPLSFASLRYSICASLI